jgi:ribosomal protein S3
MAIESKFIDNPIEKHKVMKFLEVELDRAGVANIEIQRTPVVTRIAIEVLNPGREEREDHQRAYRNPQEGIPA